VVTHQHIDHLGLVEIIATRSGAEVAAIDVVVPFVERYGSDTERDDEFAGGLMRRYGIPEDVVAALRSVSALHLPPPVRGETVRRGRSRQHEAR
jgi:glyoxylase-like metal-dependent hydrolase (beta-lactamase superfamily II)